MDSSIVLYPAPALGHLVSMVELAKNIHRTTTTTTTTTKVTVLAAIPSYDDGSIAAFLSRATAEIPFITFLRLPQVPVDRSKCPSGEAAVFQVLHRSNPHVREALQSLDKISAFVIDIFCTCALPIGKELEIPTYYFFTSAAACLALVFYTPTLLDVVTEDFKDMGETPVNVPGVPPVPSSQMFRPLLVRGTEAYDGVLNICRSMPESDGVIVNTYEALEARAVRALRDGGCNPNGRTPPIFCVGPIVKEEGPACDRHECVEWLDAQPEKSVVFLCFGSSGLHSARQLREMAVGMERSGLRFLWVVRAPESAEEPDLDSFFPAGFLNRTRDRGLVVATWVPQVGVLNHGSVGGFVSHCGWNSVVEAVWAGVPMVAWPLYAEQHFNRVLLVEELGLALRFKEEEDGFVTSDELEIGVRELMGSERGRRVRERVEEMSVEAKAAMAVGGSSYVALHKLVQAWKLTS